MGLDLHYEEGQTPIDEDETADLKVKSISTMTELDQFEELNIEDAMDWVYGRSFKLEQVLSIDFIQDIHRRMFNNVWRWAGKFRTTEKNIGVPYYSVREELVKLIGDCNYWIKHSVFQAKEIAVRFKHRLVSIHPFPNGNGRHSRLMGEILLKALVNKDASFSWGRRSLRKGKARNVYINALKKADNQDFKELMEFAES